MSPSNNISLYTEKYNKYNRNVINYKEPLAFKLSNTYFISLNKK